MSEEHSENDVWFTTLLRDAAGSYRRPPDVPRDAMWAAVSAAVPAPGASVVRLAQHANMASTVPHRAPSPWYARWTTWTVPVAMCALVGVGVVIGRSLHHASPTTAVANGPAQNTDPALAAPAQAALAVPRPTDAYYVEVSNLLAAFEDATRGDPTDVSLSGWARDLLSRTQVLLDSPVAQDARRRKLLLDLELVLVKMVQLSPPHSAQDTELIERAIRQIQLIPRLQSVLPAHEAGA